MFSVGPVRIAALLMWLLITGCTSNPDMEAPRQVTSSVPVTTVAEATPPRAAFPGAVQEWLPQRPPGVRDFEDSDRAVVRSAVENNAAALAAPDYTALALADFVTETRALQVLPQHFVDGESHADAWGRSPAGEEIALVIWRGEKFPQRPDRPLVTRWIQVNVLYNLSDRKVLALVATIGGEVQE